MFPIMFLFSESLTVYTFFPPFFALVGLLGFLMYVWIGYFNGVGTPEWMMGKIGGFAQRKNKK